MWTVKQWGGKTKGSEPSYPGNVRIPWSPCNIVMSRSTNTNGTWTFHKELFIFAMKYFHEYPSGIALVEINITLGRKQYFTQELPD